jgi:hypothetical protein
VIDFYPQANDPPISDTDKKVAQERESQQSDASRSATRDDVRRQASAVGRLKRNAYDRTIRRWTTRSGWRCESK